MPKKRMRIAELSRESGVSRETIHYYLREGLLPKPAKTGKTAAYYDESHLERLRLIRVLRDDKYLPVAVIREIVQSAGARADDRDLATLADVLAIDPTLARTATPEPARTADEEALRVALELGLLGPGERRSEQRLDPTEARVLGAVAEALTLEGAARELTLEDLSACARELSRLVELEAGLFFDLVLGTGDTAGAVQALKAGRGAVARFVTAYRDLMLRRVVEAILEAVEQGPELLSAVRPLPLGGDLSQALGVRARTRDLTERARGGDPAAANDLVWHLFVLGSHGDIVRISDAVRRLLRPRAEFLLAYAELASDDPAAKLAASLDRAGAFPLGEILTAERALAQLVSAPTRSGGFLDRAVPALHRLTRAAPDKDADPLASALAFLRRGKLAVVLPRALGRRLGALSDLERALEAVLTVPGRIDPAMRAFIEGNARLTLGRAEGSRSQLERAHAIDPTGPIGEAAAADLAR